MVRINEDVEPVGVDDFWYDLFEGGYIKPKDFVYYPGALAVIEEAIAVLKSFKDDVYRKELVYDL